MPYINISNHYNDWSLIKNKMTYIIAGNFNNQPFLMVDSIATGNTGLGFAEKLFKLESSDIFTTLSGTGGLMTYLRLYDEWMLYTDTVPNYELTQTIRDVINAIPKSTLSEFRGPQRLFFLTSEKVFYYDLSFANGVLTNVLNRIDIPLNNYVLCHQNIFTPIQNPIPDLYTFSSQEITNYNVVAHQQWAEPLHNFKNRFSFVKYDGKFEHIRPFIDLTEFLLFSFGNINWNDVVPKP